MIEKLRMIPVWVFVGAMMVVCGLLILATGFFGLSHSPSTFPARLHPAIGWGAAILVSGLFMGALAFRGSPPSSS